MDRKYESLLEKLQEKERAIYSAKQELRQAQYDKQQLEEHIIRELIADGNYDCLMLNSSFFRQSVGARKR